MFLSFSFAGFFSHGFSDEVQSQIRYVHNLWVIVCISILSSVLFVQYKRPGGKNLAASDGRKYIANNIIAHAGFLMSCLIPSLSSTSCDVMVKSETPSRSSLWTPVDTLWSNKPSRSLCKYKSLLLANEKTHQLFVCCVLFVCL